MLKYFYYCAIKFLNFVEEWIRQTSYAWSFPETFILHVVLSRCINPIHNSKAYHNFPHDKEDDASILYEWPCSERNEFFYYINYSIFFTSKHLWHSRIWCWIPTGKILIDDSVVRNIGLSDWFGEERGYCRTFSVSGTASKAEDDVWSLTWFLGGKIKASFRTCALVTVETELMSMFCHWNIWMPACRNTFNVVVRLAPKNIIPPTNTIFPIGMVPDNGWL